MVIRLGARQLDHHHVGKTIVAALDWGLDIQAAIDLPNFAAEVARRRSRRDRIPSGCKSGSPRSAIRLRSSKPPVGCTASW